MRSFGWGNATVTLQTKKIKGLHENDFIMATKDRPHILSGCESVSGSELSGACALFGPHRRVSGRVAVAD